MALSCGMANYAIVFFRTLVYLEQICFWTGRHRTSFLSHVIYILCWPSMFDSHKTQRRKTAVLNFLYSVLPKLGKNAFEYKRRAAVYAPSRIFFSFDFPASHKIRLPVYRHAKCWHPKTCSAFTTTY